MPARLVEREQQLGALEEAIGQASAGRGRLLLFEGQPGVGKTALIEAAVERARAAGMRVLRASGAALEQDLGWGVVRTAFGPELSDPTRRELLLREAAATAAPLFTGVVPAPAGDATSTILYGLYWLLSDLASEQPVAVVVDDAHWVDAPSARWLGHLAVRVGEFPVALVLATRPGAADAWWSAISTGAQTSVLEVSPLTRAGTEEVVATTLAGATGAHVDACHQVTGGNPFLLGELLLHLSVRSGSPPAPEEIRHLRPDSIRRAVLVRIAQIGSDATELAFAIAILGAEATLGMAAELAQLNHERAEQAAGALERADVIRTAPQLAFVHPLVLDVIEQEIPAARRGRMHKSASALLAARGAAANLLAPHLLATEPDASAEVVGTLRAAAAQAIATGATENAAGYLRRALAEPPPDSELGAVLVELGRAEGMLGDPAGIDRLRLALRRSVDPRERGLIVTALAPLLAVAGELQEMIAVSHEVAAELPESERELRLELLAHARTAAAQTLAPLVDDPPGIKVAELKGETPGERILLAAVANSGTRTTMTPMSKLCEMSARALGGTALIEDVGSESPQFWAAATTMMFGDHYEEIERQIALAVADSRRRGSPRGYTLCLAFGSSLLYRSGRLSECVEDARRAVELLTAEPLVRSYALSFLLDALIDRGELEDARQAIGGEPIDELPSTAAFSLLRFGRARLWRCAGDHEGALRELTTLDAALGDFSPVFTPWRAELALALQDAGDSARAHDTAADEVRRAERVQSRWAQARALHALGTITGVLEPLERAEQATRGLPIRLERARVLVELGAALRRQGRTREAQPLLREGLDLADRCGATPLAARARDELLAAGARPRRPRITGRDALTASELRVCRMAADGATNREIAQALFVSLRTVETHLTKSYDKLGLTGRNQLATALTRSSS